MYASEVDGQKLTFFVSGKLWGRSLVMQDKETGSEWSHILGKAQAGSLKGKSLKIIASVMTDWGSWAGKHPKTTVTTLRPTAMNFNTELLMHGERFGFGLVRFGKARFWRFDRLEQQPLVNDEFQNLPLVVYFDVESRTPVAWQRKVEDQLLSFERSDEGVQDRETKSLWDLQLGVATKGPLEGTRLEAVPAIVSFTHAWNRFHPDSTQWQPAD